MYSNSYTVRAIIMLTSSESLGLETDTVEKGIPEARTANIDVKISMAASQW